MSLFHRLWNFIRRPTGYVGKDLQGNYFYEHPSALGDRPRRAVKYRGQTDTLAVVERSRQLAVQWKAWLTHTRQQPPTLEELRADALRQERLRFNVALIEAREREERLRLNTETQAMLSEPQNGASKYDDRDTLTDNGRVNSDSNAQSLRQASVHHASAKRGIRDQKKYDYDPWVPQPASDEPQTWTPKAMQRGE